MQRLWDQPSGGQVDSFSIEHPLHGEQEHVDYGNMIDARDRSTTVLKAKRVSPMRIVGIQSGNAVDGIDVGVFEFAPPRRDLQPIGHLRRRYRPR